jgi:uncharacterized protein YyaL (SSP411 family)
VTEEDTHFHFSPRPNRAHEIHSRHWGPQAFQDAQALPADPSPAVYICLGTTCSPPVTDPSTLAAAVQQMRSAASQTL